MKTSTHIHPQPISRRQMLQQSACGFGYLAFAGLAAANVPAATASPFTPRIAHLPPRARRCIFLFMHGGVSQMDSFDPKPRLNDDHDKPLPYDLPGLIDTSRLGKLYGVPWKWKRHGECGQWVSELFPHMARHVDKMGFLHAVHTQGQAHGQAVLRLHTGEANFIRPSFGSWVAYGLGTENQNLPGFVAIGYPPDHGGVTNYGAAFLPAAYQGTLMEPSTDLQRAAKIRHLEHPQMDTARQQRQLGLIQSLNRHHQQQAGHDPNIEGLVQSYELAFRMQAEAPEVFDISGESQQTRELYGIGEEHTDDFGRRCLLARRLAESGVRFVQVSSGYHWDHHADINGNMISSARKTDKPIAGLLADLDARGMLEDTLVLWTGEFGRTPIAQIDNPKPGRDHNPHAFTIWMAGGGVQGGAAHGQTDDYGFVGVDGKVHMHDLHATLLYLMGLDHERLTYRYAGRDFRLTDVYGHVVQEILA